MASRNPYRGNAGAAQAFIHSLGFTDAHPKGATAERIAWNLERQLERGQPLDYPAARGHAVTPEHPGRKLPNKFQYASNRPSKYVASRTAPRPIAGGARPGGIARPVIARPLTHDFRGVTPDRRAVKLGGGRLLRTVTQPRQAIVMIQHAARMPARVRIDIFDCTHNLWISFFRNEGHAEGMTAAEILRRWKESGLTFEEWLIHLARSGRYGKAGERLTHICLFRLFITPVQAALAAPPSAYRRRR